MNYDKNRKTVLENLVEWKGNLSEIQASIRTIGWDSEEELVEFNTRHAVNVLDRYLASKIDSKELEIWANLVESRDDIKFESINEDLLKDFIFSLANPVLEGQFTR